MDKAKIIHTPQGEMLIEIKDICKTYVMGNEVVHANDHLNLTIRTGEFVVIVGKPGPGESTLMNTIGALDVPTLGTYLLDGESVGDMAQSELVDIRNRTIDFTFQQCNLLPYLNLLENVEPPLFYAHIPGDERKERALRQLERVGLKRKAKNMPNQPFGGQQQHVLIARALTGNPSLLLADELTGTSDSKTSCQILGFFQELHKESSTVIIITRDGSVAMRVKCVVRIQDGKTSFDGKAGEYTVVI